MLSAKITIRGDSIGFVTECDSAYEFLQRHEDIFDIPYQFTPTDPVGPIPILKYVDRETYSATFEHNTRFFTLYFPWSDSVPRLFNQPWHCLLLHHLFLMWETVKQERGDYTLHASAVTRDGAGIVMTGPAEAGKTITALHLCKSHGFSFFANDQVVVNLRNKHPWLMEGDATLNLRLRSINRYSESIAKSVFSDLDSQDKSWDIKKEVRPECLNFRKHEAATQIRMFVWINLDESVKVPMIQILSSPFQRKISVEDKENLFLSKIEVYESISKLIRGAISTPFSENDLTLVNLFIPNLDNPNYLEKRISFINSLFSGKSSAVLKVRGPLDESVEAIVRMFELLNCR